MENWIFALAILFLTFVTYKQKKEIAEIKRKMVELAGKIKPEN
jgi:hypothetical protein